MNPVEFYINRAIELSDQICDHYYDLGEVLFTIKDQGLYKVVDNKKYYSQKHSNWPLFCEEKLSVSYRNAQYYIGMYKYFRDMDISKEALSEIGWTKAKELTNVTTDKETLDKALEFAASHTISELKAYIDTYIKRLDEEDDAKGVSFNFKLYGAAANRATEILSVASKSTTDKNEALLKIFIEWFQLTNPIKDVSDIVEMEDMVLAYEKV